MELYYCVIDMLNGIARTFTFAFTHALLPFMLDRVNKGYKKAMAKTDDYTYIPAQEVMEI